uniref:Uncharacterized protein n=1 Tax=Oryza glumipatula TaxID=40148 RepID=A0A0E0BRR6_9ORYZ
MWERRSRTSACGSFAALSRPSGPARYRIPGLRDRLVRPRSRATVPRIGLARSDPTLRIHPTLTRAPLPTPMAGWPDLRLLPQP